MHSQKNAEFPQFSTFFRSGKDGFHTFRIPALITANNGYLLAFAEARRSRSDQAQNKMALKISKDGGKTWSDIKIIADLGKVSINNPNPVVIQPSGRILLFFQGFPYPAFNPALKPGYDDPPGELKRGLLGKLGLAKLLFKVCRSYMMYSDDNGESWSDLIENTRMVKNGPPVDSLSSGPGIGIQLKRGKYKGRLIIPFNQSPWKKFEVYAAYSDDGGETWKIGDLAPSNAIKGKPNEVQMVELDNGDVLLNARIEGPERARAIAISHNGGESWDPIHLDEKLICPRCQASIIRYEPQNEDESTNSKGMYIFANPASINSRTNGTLRLSEDNCKTWGYSRTLEPANFAYCCLTTLKDGTIGCLYETGVKHAYEELRFARVSLDWIKNQTN